MSDMDTRQLRHFRAVAETLHFGRAAEQLGMTQPPLSQSIIALERELGAPLFVRTKRQVALTPFGEQWLEHVRAALEGLEELPETARQLRDGETGRLELSFVSTADYSILPTLVRRYSALHPEVEIALSEATSDLQIAALLEGHGHAGIVIPPPGGLPGQLSYRRLLVEPLVAAVPQSWVDEGRLAHEGGRLAADALVGAAGVIFPRRVAPAFYDLAIETLKSLTGGARIVQEAIQMQTIISLVSAGIGVALVPASLRHLARTGVRYMSLPGEGPYLESGLVWRSDDATPTLRRFLDVALQPLA
ncbi:LysR family transcriptional regulator [Phenylobacterium sp. Root77]|nr:LysR family transcriptional regulator [Phenylobacterium sp. Root1277]KQW90691.1 LysR family transcriptional regulator [Phenylobacterium sp. Root1290]KRC39678.1 LysR family transcriptional regulator [Phenylobacterium sp. Root77]